MPLNKDLCLTLAALIAASCSSGSHSKHEHGTPTLPFHNFKPAIVETASNPDGGNILGKTIPRVEVSPTVDPNAPILRDIDLRNGSIGGVSISDSVQSMIAKLGQPRLYDAGKSMYYIFDNHGFMVGLSKTSANGLADSPDFISSAKWLGYKGKIVAPADLGSIQMNKPMTGVKMQATVDREEFTRRIADFVSGTTDRTTADCFQDGTCALDMADDGGAVVVLPKALLTISADGEIIKIEMEKVARNIDKTWAPTQTIQYGQSLGTLALNATSEKLTSTFGVGTVKGSDTFYANGKVVANFAPNGTLEQLTAYAGYKGILLNAVGEASNIQLGTPLNNALTCEGLGPIVVQDIDPNLSTKATCTITRDNSVLIGLPGATLFFSKNDSDKTILQTVSLRHRPIIYGESIGGLKVGQSLNDIITIYGGYKSAVGMGDSVFKLVIIDGLVVIFDNKSLKSVSVEATKDYVADIRDSGEEINYAHVGDQPENFKVTNEQSSLVSLKFMANFFETSYFKLMSQREKEATAATPAPAATPTPAATPAPAATPTPAATPAPAPAAPARTPVVAFDAINECSDVSLITPLCYIETKTNEVGDAFYSLVLPHMKFEFDKAGKLAKVRL